MTAMILRLAASGFRPLARALAAGLLAFSLSACVSIPPDQRDPDDPAESYNRGAYSFNEGLDTAVLEPTATAYKASVGEGLRQAISNFFDNLLYFDTILNSFLQGKLAQGVSDIGRLLVNTTFGFGGLFDIATPAGLPEHDEDFGQTLAVWGADSGAYLVYPLFGPSSVRDTGGLLMGFATNPITYAAAPIAIPLGLLAIIDQRATNEGLAQFIDTASLDPYVFARESYLQYRVSEVYDGNPPRRSLLDDLPEEDLPLEPGASLPIAPEILQALDYTVPAESESLSLPEDPLHFVG